MTPNRRLIAVVTAAVVAATSGCREKQVRPAELFRAQSAGLGYLETGQLPEAEEEFKKVVRLAPKEALGYANLGLTYLRGSRLREAEDQLRRARKLDPANTDIGLMEARLYASTSRTTEARATLDALRRDHPRDPRVLYAIAELEAQAGAADPAAGARYDRTLREVLDVAPANIAVRLKLIDVHVRQGAADSAVRHLEEVRRIGPELPGETREELERAIQLLRSQPAAGARPALERLLRSMELTSVYQTSYADVKWLEGPLTGRPVLSFTPKSFVMMRASTRRGATSDMVRFTDATSDAGLSEAPATSTARGFGAIATGDYDGDGADDFFGSYGSAGQGTATTLLYHVQGGQFLDRTQRSGIAVPRGAIFAAFADVDNDGHLDLFAIDADDGAHLFRNAGGGRLQDVTAKTGIGKVGGARHALFADFDHDGDLDLLLSGGPLLRFYRNNLDGTFTELAAAVGLAGAAMGATGEAAFADFDGDGRLDVIVARERGSVALYRNDGNRQFREVGATGISVSGGAAIAVSDYDNDGFFDLFVAGIGSDPSSLWLNRGDGTFTRDPRSARTLATLSAGAVQSAVFVDFDNDGWLDLAVTSTTSAGRGMSLLRNDGGGRFDDRSDILPPIGPSAAAVAATDVDGDGDQDLLVATPRGVRLLRNDGGNANLSMQLQLIGLRTGSGKNNALGTGARIEVRAAELRQTRVVTSRSTHFGLGSHLKSDVVRIEWPNGVPQTLFFPGTDQDVLENEVLKGSCAFLYTWDGKGFRFVTDVMWRSALGMPLGILGSNTAYAPAGASQEYLRIPGDALQPRDGRYVLQLTEELWETAYADEVRLLAVDHPDSVEVFVDERFVPPGPVTLRVFTVSRPRQPLSAVDERGRDVLPALRDVDDVFVSGLTPLRYQGLVEPHDLILDLGPEAGRDSTFLFLRGWIYPTDASINVALSQQTKTRVMMPSLEVRDARGRWVTAIANLGFPSGKDKTLITSLAGIFPTSDHRVRIRTNLQIYWDQALVGRDLPSPAVRIAELKPLSADLHARGFSRTYRKGGRYGPWWFDYDSVSTEPRWRPIEGMFTRFGDVRSLLASSDDMYAIMAPGDETTLEFDAASSAPLPPGWRRDFLLYTDGWIKDSDLNTAFGTSVEPLPFHKIRQYPYAAGEAYPNGAAHQRYLREYNTRRMTRPR